jgi:uncharacterized protein with HEPN domain
MRREDETRLRHMLDAAREAISFAIGRCREDLDDDRQLTLSIVKLLEIIGEAATKLAEETRSKLADLPWSDIMGMRHHLIHAYFDIDLDRVWATVIVDLPRLVTDLEAVVTDRD